MTVKNEKSLHERLAEIQKELKVPKSQFNKFANFNYRSCEDILEAVKPSLKGLILTLTDEVVNLGTRYYVKATATLTDGNSSIVNNAYAREEETKKGMDGSQITGSASSYARKYALNGLFLIDDGRDADSMDNTKVKIDKQYNDKGQTRKVEVDRKDAELVQLVLNIKPDDNFILSLAENLKTYGHLTDKQREALRKNLPNDDEYYS